MLHTGIHAQSSENRYENIFFDSRCGIFSCWAQKLQFASLQLTRSLWFQIQSATYRVPLVQIKPNQTTKTYFHLKHSLCSRTPSSKTILYSSRLILLLLPLMAIGHNAGHYCHFRVSLNSNTGSKRFTLF